MKSSLLVIPLMILVSIAPFVNSAPTNTVNVRKTIIREIDVLPGCSENTTVTVSLVFDSAFEGSLTDYIVFASGEGVSAPIPPTRILNDETRVGFSWNYTKLNAGDNLKYSVSGKNLFNVNMILNADGNPLQTDCSKGYCYATALKAHTINYTIVIEALDDLLKKQQLPISISWSVDPLYLYPIDYSESPQSLRESGTEVSFQWSSFMNGSYRLSVVFEVRGENPWGEVLLPAPTVTISLDPRLQASLLDKYRAFTLRLLEENIGNITVFKENVTRLRDLLFNLSDGFDEQASMLENAAFQANEAAVAMSNAAAQLSLGLSRMNNAESSIRGALENASSTISKAKEIASNIRLNISKLENQLEPVLKSLNMTNLNLSTSDISSLLNEAQTRLSLLQSQVESAKNLLDEYSTVKSQLVAGTENMIQASVKLTLMSNILRESARKLRELSRGLRQAGELIDSSLSKLANLLDAPVYPESFVKLNSTILSQQTVSNTPSVNLKTDLMGDIVYISLPLVKIKRSEPQVSNVSLESPATKVQGYWPIIFTILIAGVYVSLLRHRALNTGKASATDFENRIRTLKEKISRLEVNKNV
mgnify:CR=1 FL=1